MELNFASFAFITYYATSRLSGDFTKFRLNLPFIYGTAAKLNFYTQLLLKELIYQRVSPQRGVEK